MMTNAFVWLENYKDQIGLAIQLGLLIATAVLIRVGVKQATAATAQAKAADAQAVAAAAQSTTAQNQLDLSIKQLYAGLSSSDAATRPIIKLSPPKIFNLGQSEQPFLIVNCGLGPALDLEAFYGAVQSEVVGLYGEFLGVNDQKTKFFEMERMKQSHLTVQYSSTQGARYETTLHFVEGQFTQFHRKVKNPFDGIID